MAHVCKLSGCLGDETSYVRSIRVCCKGWMYVHVLWISISSLLVFLRTNLNVAYMDYDNTGCEMYISFYQRRQGVCKSFAYL